MTRINRDRFAAVNIHWRLYPFERFLETQRELGVKTIELWAGAPHFLLGHEECQDSLELKKTIEGYGLKAAVFTPECVTYPYPVCADGEDSVRRTEAYYVNAIRAAEKLGVSVMPVSCAGALKNEDPRAAFDRAVKMLRKLSDAAGQSGVCLAVETLPPVSAPIVNTLAELKDLLEAVGSSSVKACMDICSARTAGETIPEWFDTFGSGIRHIHFTDGRPAGRMVWGQGLHPLDEYVEEIASRGYEGYLGLNVNVRGNWFDPSLLDDRKGFTGTDFYPDNYWFAPAAADAENVRMLAPYMKD